MHIDLVTQLSRVSCYSWLINDLPAQFDIVSHDKVVSHGSMPIEVFLTRGQTEGINCARVNGLQTTLINSDPKKLFEKFKIGSDIICNNILDIVYPIYDCFLPSITVDLASRAANACLHVHTKTGPYGS